MRIKPVLFAFFIASLGFSGEAGAQFPSFADLAEKLTPSVVNISSFSQSETENGEGEHALVGISRFRFYHRRKRLHHH